MKKALIFYGGWEGHTPKETAYLFKQWLEDREVQVTLSDSLECLEDLDSLRQYDLIVPVWTMGKISRLQCDNVCQAVAEGAGLAGCHGGMCDAFREECLWQFMTGAQWVAHPGGNQITYTVNLKPGNPFTEGLTDFSVHSEQYYIHVDPAVKVWATTRFPIAEGPYSTNGTVDVPVIFTKSWGKGKVYYNSLGHTWEIFDIPQARETMLRGLLWAMR